MARQSSNNLTTLKTHEIVKRAATIHAMVVEITYPDGRRTSAKELANEHMHVCINCALRAPLHYFQSGLHNYISPGVCTYNTQNAALFQPITQMTYTSHPQSIPSPPFISTPSASPSFSSSIISPSTTSPPTTLPTSPPTTSPPIPKLSRSQRRAARRKNQLDTLKPLN